MSRFTSALVLICALDIAPAALATTHVVQPNGSGDFPTIAAAISAASPGDTISLGDGTFTGSGNTSLNFGGKQLVVRSLSGEAASCVIDLNGNARAFTFNSGEDSTSVLESFTITRLNITSLGGAIYCISSSPRISGCILRNNKGGRGAGISCMNACSPIVSDCTFVSNSGASIFYGGSPRMSGCTFAYNDVSTSVIASIRPGAAFSNIIIAHNGSKAFDCSQPGSTITCSDIFSNAGGDWIDCLADRLGVDGNISADPLFCDSQNRDYTLAENSLCAPENNPECGLIGSWPIGCPTSCTLELTPSRVVTYYPCDGSFPMDLWIDQVVELGSFDVCIGFPPLELSSTGVSIDPEFLGSTGRVVQPTPPSPCYGNCWGEGILVGANTLGLQPGPSGGGRLATLFWRPRGVSEVTEESFCFEDWTVRNTEAPPENILVSHAAKVELVHQPFCYGDFDDNGDVGIVDVMRLGVRWGTRVGDEDYEEKYDVNLLEPDNYCASVPDGSIDIVDVQSVAARWAHGCPGAFAPAGAPASPSTEAQRWNDGVASKSSTWIRIAPEVLSLSGEAGDTGVFTLEVEAAPSLGAFESTLVYDPSVIHVEEVEIGSFLGTTGRSVYPLEPRIDNENGVLTLGAWSVGESPGAEGNGVLARVTVSILSCPAETSVDISRAALTDVSGWPQALDGIAGGTVVTECETPSSAPLPLPLPDSIDLLTCRPNPFSSSTTISFAIDPVMEKSVPIQLLIVDASGRTVRKLVNDYRESGRHEIEWDGRDDRGLRAPGGAYFCRLRVGKTQMKRQIILVDWTGR